VGNGKRKILFLQKPAEKHGGLRGAIKGIWRILRCNPLCKGGEDWP